MKNWSRGTDVMNALFIYGMFLMLLCCCVVPALSQSSLQHHGASRKVGASEKNSEGDVPTWYLGDQWIYSVDPLYYSDQNITFSGAINNYKQEVLGIEDGLYEVELSGQISGDLTMNGVSGEVTGVISGVSFQRVSDLAQVSTTLHSDGTILVIFISIPYVLDVVAEAAPALESFDYPLMVGEQWQIASLVSTSGAFIIEGFVDQSLNSSLWIEETVECMGTEQVSVPAGVFDSYILGRDTAAVWYSSTVGNVVKSSADYSDENMTVNAVLSLQSYSLVAQPITVTENIEPAVVIPGAAVVISGQATNTGTGAPVQNGAITIEIPSTGDIWSTTTDATGMYSESITAPILSDDTPSGRETGSDGVIVSCSSGGLSGYHVQSLVTMQDTAPAAPSIDGESEGKIKKIYNYTFLTVDLDGDVVYYDINWSDGTPEEIIGPFASSQEAIVSHSWSKKGTYVIKAKAIDIYGAESDWGSLEVIMPTDRQMTQSWFFSLLERFPHAFPLLRIFFDC